MKLTNREKEIILEKELGSNVNVSLGQALHARMRALFEQESDRYAFAFSNIIKEACHCFLHYGPDWRANTANGELSQIKDALEAMNEKIGKLKLVAQSGDNIAIADEVNRMFGDEGGFSE